MRRHRRGADPALAAVTLTMAMNSFIVFAQAECGEWTLVDPPAGAIAVAGVEVRSAHDAWAIAYLNPNPKGVIRWDGGAWSVIPTDGVAASTPRSASKRSISSDPRMCSCPPAPRRDRSAAISSC